jgi:hypothetical protein
MSPAEWDSTFSGSLHRSRSWWWRTRWQTLRARLTRRR